VSNFKPGNRVQLNELSGNPGRLAFVLFESNTNAGEFLVRFDGFAYNTLIRANTLELLPDEPFRE
jgi:hypothetical protein